MQGIEPKKTSLTLPQCAEISVATIGDVAFRTCFYLLPISLLSLQGTLRENFPSRELGEKWHVIYHYFSARFRD